MKDTDIVIAYISPDTESGLHARILEVLRMRMIQTTDDIEKATVVIHTTQQMPGPGMTLEELAAKIVEHTDIHEFKIPEPIDRNFVTPVVEEPRPVLPIKKQQKKFIPKYVKQYNQTNQIQRTRFLTRTTCKGQRG